MPFVPSSFLLLVAMPFVPSSFLFLVVWPGGYWELLAPSNKKASGSFFVFGFSSFRVFFLLPFLRPVPCFPGVRSLSLPGTKR